MHLLTINFGPAGKDWIFMFKEKERAEHFNMSLASAKGGGQNGMNQPVVMIEDEFHQKAAVESRQIHAWAVEDLDIKCDATNEMQVATIRGQVRLEQKVQGDPDPALKAAIQRAKQQSIIRGGMAPGPMPMA